MNGAIMTTRTALQRAATTAAAAATVGLSGLLGGGCATAHVKVDPLEVKPITVNVNVNLRVQQQLDQFFSYEDKLLTGGDTTRPTSAPAPAKAPSDGVH